MADMQRWEAKEPYLPLQCQLGEGPYYEASTDTFRWVDIDRKRLHSVIVNDGPGSLKSLQLEDSVSVTANIQNNADEIIVAAKYGFAIMNKHTGALRYIQKVIDSHHPERTELMRFNDGAISPSGHFFAGTMSDPVLGPMLAGAGTLYRLSPSSLAIHAALKEITVPNGIGWSPSGKTMYFTDSPALTIYAFDFDIATGEMTRQRPWFVLGGEEKGCAPDGLAVDEQGGVWVAVYGAGKVLWLGEDAGLKGMVSIQASRATCPRFVGTELWVTSAREEGGEGGELFRVEVGLRGLEPWKWKGRVV